MFHTGAFGEEKLKRVFHGSVKDGVGMATVTDGDGLSDHRAEMPGPGDNLFDFQKWIGQPGIITPGREAGKSRLKEQTQEPLWDEENPHQIGVLWPSCKRPR